MNKLSFQKDQSLSQLTVICILTNIFTGKRNPIGLKHPRRKTYKNGYV